MNNNLNVQLCELDDEHYTDYPYDIIFRDIYKEWLEIRDKEKTVDR